MVVYAFVRRLVLAALIAALVAPAGRATVPAGLALSRPPEAAPGAALAPERAPRPLARSAGRQDLRCTADRRSCIALGSYIPDVCRTIAAAAAENALDTGFFARLLWRESLFDAGAVSPAGALGIAQFIPETAKRRGLADPFNPAEAVHASARYLADLARAYGNLGLAAVAYNGGEARAERFIAGAGGLAAETRAYVQAITGHSAEAWRDAPPKSVDLALGGEGGFEANCITLASSRTLREFKSAPPTLPWGVVVASNRARDGAQRQMSRLQNRYAAVLRGEPVSYTRGRRPGMRGSLHYAQIGRNSRAEADALCGRLRAAGGDCMVIRN
jgi:hypothetical protein